jgi:hypothetical protein
MPSELGQSSSKHVRRPGKEVVKPVTSNEVKLGCKIDSDILRPASASDFNEFLKNRYPDLLGSDIVDYLKFHNARCILHSNIFKDSIIRENMRLAGRLLDKRRETKTHDSLLQAKPASWDKEEYFSASEPETDLDAKRPRNKKNGECTLCVVCPYLPQSTLYAHCVGLELNNFK